MPDGLGFPAEPPEFEVWNYLESGLHMARDEIGTRLQVCSTDLRDWGRRNVSYWQDGRNWRSLVLPSWCSIPQRRTRSSRTFGASQVIPKPCRGWSLQS